MPIHFLINRLPKISSRHPRFLLSPTIVAEKISSLKAKAIIKKITPHLKGKTILDVGFGAGTIASGLVQLSYHVTGLDVVNSSLYSDITPILYDGQHMPFVNHQFDTAIIIHVLHHCRSPVDVLREAKRCSHRVIFIEDTYRTRLEKLIVSLGDNLGNFEFYQHPYLTVDSWQKKLTRLGMKIIFYDSWSKLVSASLFPSRYCLFVVE